MTKTNYSPDAAALRNTLTSLGIKEPMWSGFHWSCKMNGAHIRQTQLGDATFELRIEAEGRGYRWSFGRV